MAKRQRPSKPWFMVSGIAATLAILIVVASWVFMQKNQTGARVDTAGSKPTAVQGGMGGKGSPEYNSKLTQKKDEEAEAAAKSGKSYVPPVINKSEDDLDALLDIGGDADQEESDAQKMVEISPPRPERRWTPPPEPAPESDRVPQSMQPQVQQQPINNEPSPAQAYANERAEALREAMLNTMSQVNQSMALAPAQTMVYTAGASWPTKEQEPNEEDLAAQNAQDEQSIELYPGDVLYAVVDQFLNSDAPVPAFRSTVVSGKHKGAIILGRFERVGESLALSFERMRTPDNKIYEIQGYGVDPESTDGRLASDVDRHTVSRWGSVIAASLLKGWGEAVKDMDTETYTTGDTIIQNRPDYSFGEQALIASGETGNILADKAINYFDRPPTVKLRQGFPVGIVILDVSN
jgi:hypothetical protein